MLAWGQDSELAHLGIKKNSVSYFTIKSLFEYDPHFYDTITNFTGFDDSIDRTGLSRADQIGCKFRITRKLVGWGL